MYYITHSTVSAPGWYPVDAPRLSDYGTSAAVYSRHVDSVLPRCLAAPACQQSQKKSGICCGYMCCATFCWVSVLCISTRASALPALLPCRGRVTGCGSGHVWLAWLHLLQLLSLLSKAELAMYAAAEAASTGLPRLPCMTGLAKIPQAVHRIWHVCSLQTDCGNRRGLVCICQSSIVLRKAIHLWAEGWRQEIITWQRPPPESLCLVAHKCTVGIR